MDNGAPWGSWKELPPALALWWIGLGIDPLWNPPRCPQHNAKVERSHGVAHCWAEPRACRSVAELQRRLDHMDVIQRERYPSVGARSRAEAYRLDRSPRLYSRQWEQSYWNWERAVDHLSQYVVVGKVDSSGKFSVHWHKYYVGLQHKGEHVWVQLDPCTQEWIVSDRDGRQLSRQQARSLDPQRIQRWGQQEATGYTERGSAKT